MDTAPLRFAFVTTFYPPYHFGGDAIGIQRLARGLVRRGHRVTVLHDLDAYTVVRRGALPPPAPAEKGLEVIGIRSGFGPLSPLLTQQTGHPVLTGRRLRRILEGRTFDVITYHNVSLIGGPGVFRLGRGVKVYMAHEHWLVCPTHVLWRHGREPCPDRECLRCQLTYRRPPQWWRRLGVMERALDHVDLFIAMSEFSREKHREFGFPREMEVLPYFLPDPERSAAIGNGCGEPVHPRPYFLFVGRLEKIKGVQDILPIFRGYEGADLLIAGEGEFGEVLQAAAADLPNVRFLGRVEPDSLTRYYAEALALIVPSVCYETFGIILIEAFRMGVPVLARRIGPFPEIVSRAGGGLLFETDADLKEGMEQIRLDPALRSSLAQAGRKAFSSHWSEEAVVPRYLDLVNKAARRRGVGLPIAEGVS